MARTRMAVHAGHVAAVGTHVVAERCANRARVERLKASKRVAALLRLLAVVVLVGWILIWLFASEDSRNRLTQEVKQTIGGFGRSDTAPGSAE